MNQLDTYLRQDGAITARALASAVGISSPYITDLRYSRRKPSDEIARRIEVETGGAVRAAGWREPARGGAA